MSFCAVPVCVSLSLGQRRQTILFVMINPTTFHRKPNESFMGFMCFPVFQHCFEPRNVMFVLCEIRETSHSFFSIRLNCSLYFSDKFFKVKELQYYMSLPLSLVPRLSRLPPANYMPRTVTVTVSGNRQCFFSPLVFPSGITIGTAVPKASSLLSIFLRVQQLPRKKVTPHMSLNFHHSFMKETTNTTLDAP